MIGEINSLIVKAMRKLREDRILKNFIFNNFLCGNLVLYLGFLGVLILSSCGQKAESCFGYSQQDRPSDFPLIYTLPVKFSNCSSEAESFEWSFGDGVISSAKNPEHLYQFPGKYTISLTSRFKNKVEKSSKTLLMVEPSLSDSLLNTWELTEVKDYILNNNYPVDSLELSFSKTIWNFTIDGTLQISGFPFSTNEKWSIFERQLITQHKTYAIQRITSNNLLLVSQDTLNTGHPEIKSNTQRKLWFEAFSETP
jgi:hypothetical protein